MSHSSRRRPSSPGAKRVIADPVRASTGTVALNSSYDYSSAANRHGYNNKNGYSSDVVGHGKVYAPQPNPVESRLEVQPISSQTYRDPPSQSTRMRTEYAVRSRPRSSTTSTPPTGGYGYWDRLRNTTSNLPSSSSRLSPVVSSGYNASPTSSYPLRLPYTQENPESSLLPASSHNDRHRRRDYSTDYASDSGRLHPGRKSFSKRARDNHGVYPGRGHGSRRRWRYSDTGDSKKKEGEGVDAHNAYSYMTPKENFERESNDYLARLNHRRGGYREERPLSMTAAEDGYNYYSRSPPRTDSRISGPPESYYSSGTSHTPSRHHFEQDGAIARDRSSRQRAPVSLHQDRDDGHYSHRHRRHHDNDDIDDRRHRDDGALTKYNAPDAPAPPGSGGAGLGSAVLAKVYPDDGYDLPATHSRIWPRDPEGDYKNRQDPRSRDRLTDSLESRSNRHDYRDHRGQQLRRSTELGGASDGGGYVFDRPRSHRYELSRGPRRDGGSKSSSSDDDKRASAPVRAKTPHPRKFSRSRRRVEGYFSDEDESTSDDFQRQKRPITVEAAPMKELEAVPKGILKAPTDKFPEEPNPVREGVAPLKDAHKKGIPPGARWTKIDRKLVNPAALEAGHERFEERSAFVIVLRVLSKEEIQAYAVKTQEIRDVRYHEYVREKRQRMEAARRHGFNVEEFSSDDEYDEDYGYGRNTTTSNNRPLAIEAPPELEKSTAPRPNLKALNPLMAEQPTRTS